MSEGETKRAKRKEQIAGREEKRAQVRRVTQAEAERQLDKQVRWGGGASNSKVQIIKYLINSVLSIMHKMRYHHSKITQKHSFDHMKGDQIFSCTLL